MKSFLGMQYIDDKSGALGGYIYGFELSGSDLLEEFDENYIQSVETYNGFLNGIKQDQMYNYICDFIEENDQKITYVSNFVMDQKHRFFAHKMLMKFLDLSRSNGKKYLVFQALTDTINLMFDSKGKLKERRLNKSNITPLAHIKIVGDERRIIIVSI
jgi:hypothetical protein